MHDYLDKAALYNRIEERRNMWHIQKTDYPLNTIKFCKSLNNVIIREALFKTPGLRGIATKREDIDKSDIILLNSNRSNIEKNFDCCHELIHLTEHRNTKTQSFHCFDNIQPHQNVFLEWQANEGSAEMLVPYNQFLPLLKDNQDQLHIFDKIQHFKKHLSSMFNVTNAVITIRLDSLKYEIYQYLNGCDLDKLEILSAEKQKNLGIKVSSINDIEEVTMAQYYCFDEYVTDDEKNLLDYIKFGE